MICGAAVVFLISAKRLGAVTGLLLFSPLVAACGMLQSASPSTPYTHLT